MKDTRVGTWNELSDCLYQSSWQEELGRFRSYVAFRGTGRANHDLTTGIARLENRGALEDALLRAFRKYAHREAVPGESVWNWLALAQHHGLPTRLLDWTYSPFVAMHFVTEDIDCYDFDGVIWAIDYRKTNRLLPQKLKRILADEGSNTFTAEMLGRAASSLKQFDELSDETFVAFFEPPSLDARIVNQYALFSLLSQEESSMDEWLAQHPDVCERYVIPNGLKWEIRDKLDQANVTERVLYPGLDGLSMWLKRYYTPRI